MKNIALNNLYNRIITVASVFIILFSSSFAYSQNPTPTPRECLCSPLYENSNFEKPVLISGSHLSVGAVYRFENVFPNNAYNTTLDALVEIIEFSGGASLLNIDVTGTGRDEHFQPRINATNNDDQSVLFNITFVTEGGTVDDDVVISFFGTPFDIDGNGDGTREYAEISLPDAYYLSNNPEIEITQTSDVVRGEAITTAQAPGGDVSLDPKWTFSNYFENKSSLNYRIGKVDGSNDRYYSLDMRMASYDNPDSVLITYPVICGNVSDENGTPLVGVAIDVTGSDGSTQTVTTDADGNYKGVAEIPEFMVAVTYEISENDPPGYFSVSDVDGANDNLITQTIDLASTCGNDFVDGVSFKISIEDQVNILCNGDATGSLTVSVAGGLPPYEFTLNGGPPQDSPTFNGLIAGSYVVAVTDSLGNNDILNVLITQPEALSIQFTKIDSTQSGGCSDGQATAAVTGGTLPYTYQWSGPGGFSQTTDTITGLIEGIYTLDVTDGNNCTIQQMVVIDCVDDCDAVISLDNKTNVLCAGELTGSATVSASSLNDAGALFTFTWSNGQIDAAVTTSTVNGLGAGVYTVDVTIDGTECPAETLSITITEPSSALNVTATATCESGPGANDGTANVVASGGTPPYTYSWNSGETTSTITGLSAGDYTVMVTDANNCMNIVTVNVCSMPCDLVAIASSTLTSCQGGSDGTATVGVTGGSGNVTYLWSPGGQTTQTITNLTAGSYTVTVTDLVTTCVVQSTTTVNEPVALSSGISVTDLTCFGENSGALDLTVTGGTFPYAFVWSNGATNEDLVGLAAGTYEVTITDANGCVTTNSAEVSGPTESLDLSYTVVDVLCNGDSSGAVNVSVTGGTPPYFYSWSNGATTEDLVDLSAGIYNVMVTDANGCQLTKNNIVVNEPNNPLSIIITKQNPTAAQDCQDGEATATVNGGTAPYTYLWSPSTGGQTTSTATNLPLGIHTVTITDANGCILVQSLVLNDCTTICDAIISIDNITDVLCTGDSTGSATVSASSLTYPASTFTFTWDTGQVNSNVTTSTLSDLSAGVYTVSVTINGSDCEPIEQSVTIVEPASALNLTASATDESGPNTEDGTATATASGGTPPYEYSWSSGGATTEVITDLSAGTYTVTVTDANGCTAMATAMVNPATCLDLAVTAYATSTTCSGDSDGSAIAFVTGGSGSFTYSWSPGGANTQAITGITAGTYIVTITDTITECTVQATTTVNEPNTLSSGIAVSNIICFGDDTGSLDLTVSGGTFPYTFSWSNGAETEDINNLITGSYSVTITDANGCIATNSATVLQPDTDNTSTDAIPDINDTLINIEVSGNVLTNDEDLQGDAQIVISNTDPSNGTVVVNTNGSYTYTPNLDFVGVDSFEYTIQDDGICNQATDTTIVVITVLESDLPLENTTTANDDTAGTIVDQPVSGNVLLNDFDVQFHNQLVTNVGTFTTNQGGSITIAVDGSYSYTPPSGFIGEDTFQYFIEDDAVAPYSPIPAIDDAILTITVRPVLPHEIFANDDAYAGCRNTSISGNVLLNDTDPDASHSITVDSESPIVGPFNGSVTINSDGTFTYTPNLDYFGPDQFVYQISDDGSSSVSDQATAYITVLPPTNLTYGFNDFTATLINIEVSGNVLTNDEDLEGDNQVIISNTDPSNGTLVMDVDGSYTYTPNPNFVGVDSIEYTIQDDAICDPAFDSATLFISIIPTSINTTTANPDNAETYVDVPVVRDATNGLLSNDNDSQGDDQVVTTVGTYTTTQGGSITVASDGSYTYIPPPGFVSGIKDTYTYAIVDNAIPQVAVDSAILAITVYPRIPENDTFAYDDFYFVKVDMTLTGNVLINDIDNQGDTQEVTVASPLSGPSNGTVTINADGTFTYTPNAGYIGPDSFVYGIVDDGDPEATDQATVHLLIDENLDVNTILAIDDINVTNEGMTIDGNVATNDWNFDGPDGTEVFTLVDGTGPANGTLTFNDDGTYTYSPNAGFVGEDQFAYQVCDGGTPVACDTAFVYIEVLGDSGPPVAVADTNVTNVNTPVDGEVLPNDYDTNGDPISVTANTDPSNGTLVINPDGSYTYTPNQDFIGEDTFTYTICDATPICDTTIVTIQVLPSDDNITHAVDDEYYTTAGVEVMANVLDNDSDNQGDTQEVTDTSPLSGPSNGTLTLNADGTFTYVPNDGFLGTDSFVYSIVDSGDPVATDTATVYIYVDEDLDVNTILAIDDINVTNEGMTIDGNVATNDWNFDGPDGTEVFTLVDGTGPANGTLTFNDDGTYTYSPNAGFVGEDQFAYQVCDGGTPVACDTAFVYIEVLGDSGPPVAVADTNVTNVNTPVDGEVLPNDYDTNGDPISVTANTDPSNGTLVINPDGSYTYTPNQDFIGEDTFTYTICDATPICDTTIVTIQVLPSDDNITHAVDDEYYTTAGVEVMANVLDNDSDNQGDTQEVTDTSPLSGPSNGTLTLNADGTFTYVPNDGFLGTDSFVYSIVDSGDPVATDTATVYIYVDEDLDVNTILAIDDINVTNEGMTIDGNVATNDWNFDGPDGTEVFTLVDGTGPANGTLTFNDDGTYTYSPNAGFVGEDQFAYQVCDGGTPVACDTAFVYIEVLGDSGPPVAVADTNVTNVNTPVDGEVLPNDYDTNGDPISVTANTDPSNGTLVINPDGSYTYTPNQDFIGEDTFTYTICDATPICDTTIVTIQVLPSDDNITHAVDDEYYTTAGVEVMANVLDNDSDNQGDTQEVTDTSPLSGPSNGTLTLNADGTFTYVPNDGFLGTDSFVYSIVDSGDPVATDTATVYIYVDEDLDVNTILAIDDINVTNEGMTIDGNVATNDWNFDGPDGTEVFTLVDGTGPANGTLTFNDDGTYTYSPNAGFVGEDQFAYQVCDGGTPVACDTAFVYIEVLGDSGPPVAVADTNVTNVNTPVDGEVLPNDYDTNGDPISVTANTDPSNGTLVINPDGSYTYTPNQDFIGEDTFTYTICDATPICDTTIVTIQVLPSDDNITHAVDDEYYTTAGVEVMANVLDNDSDNQGDTQEVTDTSPLSGPSNGTLTLNADGTFTYVPNDGFLGTDSFVYSIVDSGDPVATDTATVYIYVEEAICTDLDVEITVNNVLCFDEDTGSIDLTVIGGTSSYTYLWSNGATTEDISDLEAGTYSVDITDANDCVTTVSATVLQPDNLLRVTISTDNGIATAVISGGSPPYTYLWSNGATTESISIPDVTYSVIVTDANGCMAEAEGTVGPCENIEISTTITPNGDQFNEFFEVNFIGGGCNFAIDLKIVNRWGAIVYESNDYQNDWNGVAPDSSLGSAGKVPTGTYYYIIILRSSGLNPVSGPLYIGTK